MSTAPRASIVVDWDALFLEAWGPSPGAVLMRCCGRWEEDENAVDWRSLQAGGYLHWRCAR